MTSPIFTYPSTGIEVIVIGSGFGGLTTAIECRLKGHNVRVLEKVPELKQLGDIISISPNAGQVISRWDRKMVSEKLEKVCMNHKHFRIHEHTGEWVLDQPRYPPNKNKPMFNGHRADIHKIFYDYALSLGINVLLGKTVVSYNEDKRTGKAWVSTAEGDVFYGDLVVAADGVRSQARKLMLGLDDSTQDSGYAVYRAWFDAEKAGVDKDPLTREFVIDGDTHSGWLGEDIHLLVATCKGGKEISWVMTHKDNKNIEESWSYPGNVQDVLKLIEGWDPRARAIVSKTPSCVDWKLVTRDPLPTWISKEGHMCLLGDAAHPFLPTSIQGCSQAIEAGCVLATCLALSKADASVPAASKIPTALRAYQRLRYERVKTAQKKGAAVRNMWHKIDWDAVRKNHDLIKIPREDWLLQHDCERFTRDLWDRAMQEMYHGGPPIPKSSLAAGPESNERQQSVELPPTPAQTPKEEVNKQLG